MGGRYVRMAQREVEREKERGLDMLKIHCIYV